MMPQDPLPHPSAVPHHPRQSAVPTPASMSSPSSNNMSPSSSAAAGAGLSPQQNSSPATGSGFDSPSSSSSFAQQQQTPPKVGPMSKLRGAAPVSTTAQQAPKDVIPTPKTPRKQRSSRFHVTEKVELERLPGFLGTFRLSRSARQQC